MKLHGGRGRVVLPLVALAMLASADKHSGAAAPKLAPFAQYKYLKDAPFGALLITSLNGIPLAKALKRPPGWAPKDGRLPPASEIYLRINDADQALRDDTGALTICFDFKL